MAFSPDGRTLLASMIALRRGCGTHRCTCRTTCHGWPPGSRPPPGWSLTSGARSACSTAPPGWGVASGWSSLAARRRRTRRRGSTRSSSAAIATARGDAWKERGRWERAEAAYAEAVRARPLCQCGLAVLARFHVERGHFDRAAATLIEAVRLMPDDLMLRLELSRALLWAGDRVGWRRSNAALLGRFSATGNPQRARMVARACALGPDATSDPEIPVRLAEAAVRGARRALQGRLLEHARDRALPRRPVRGCDPAARRSQPAPGRGEPASGLCVPGDGPPPTGSSCRGKALARSAAKHPTQHGPEPILECTGDSPAAWRGRGGDPLRSRVPCRPVREVTRSRNGSVADNSAATNATSHRVTRSRTSRLRGRVE